jgi:hypothetical protein
MNLTRPALILSVTLLVFAQAGCFFYSDVSTLNKQTRASGSGFLTAIEHNGQWETDGPPPRVGEVTERQVYRKFEKGAVYSLIGSSQDYQLSEPYPSRRRRIAAIRETGTSTESGKTTHYYEVEFDPETDG